MRGYRSRALGWQEKIEIQGREKERATMRTRLQARKDTFSEEDAATALVLLASYPIIEEPIPAIVLSSLEEVPSFKRTLSHTQLAAELAEPYFEHCKEEDTILANYYVHNDWVTAEYYERIGGVMRHQRLNCPLALFHYAKWKFNVCSL